MTDSPAPPTPEDGARLILRAFDDYLKRFSTITARSGERFNRRDWNGMQQDALERLYLYTDMINRSVAELKIRLSGISDRRSFVAEIKPLYARLLEDRDDGDIAESFFNSVMRNTFSTVGVNPKLEFVLPEFKVPEVEDRDCLFCYLYAEEMKEKDETNVTDLSRRIIFDFGEEICFHSPERSIATIAAALERNLIEKTGSADIDAAEMIQSVFYRDKAAYLIGRIRAGDTVLPLVIALLSQPEGAVPDAVLLTAEEISILFSFTRAYFHVLIEKPAEMVNFLKAIIPLKRVSEIYTSIGFHKHGKAELFRELMRHLAATEDRFEIAPGERGMVMLVFTLPSFNVVFKVIKDHFDYPKQTTRDAVQNRYELVFRHDRAGRLVDAQEFKHMEFETARFSEDLLEEFRRNARNNVIIDGNRLIIEHLYTERRLTPLDIYLEAADEDAARDAVIDYGRCIRELAATNIFPGDLFLKNFGVTRHGRVVFYDYDELCLLNECNFRKMPASRRHDDEMAAETWFHVDENDVFPEEFRTFLRFPRDLAEVFETFHGDLYDVAFWRDTQAALRSGKVIHIFPYKPERRLLGNGGGR